MFRAITGIFILLLAPAVNGAIIPLRFSTLRTGQVVYEPTNVGLTGGNAYFFIPPESRRAGVLLNGSLEGIAAMVMAQTFDQRGLDEFIRSDFPDLLVLALGQGHVVNPRLVNEYRSYIDSPQLQEIARVHVTVEAINALGTASREQECRVESNCWNMKFYVLSKSGVMECWALRGEVNPFNITEVSRTIDRKWSPIPRLPTVN